MNTIETNGTISEQPDEEKGTALEPDEEKGAALEAQNQTDETVTSIPADVEDTVKPSPAVRSRACIIATSCGACIFVVGLVSLILYLTGFFTMLEPCVDVQSFVISNLELGSNEETVNSNPILGVVNSLTGGLVSEYVPTQATLNLDLQLQVNNTNPFKLNYAQMNDATIKIPEYLLTNAPPTDGPVVSANDFPIGTWQLPNGVLKKRSSTILPVKVSATIDLADTASVQLVPIFLNGGAMAFLIQGGITGSTWVPFVSGDVRFLCLAEVSNVLSLGEDAKIRCRTSINVGDFINKEGEINLRRLQDFMNQPVDPACMV